MNVSLNSFDSASVNSLLLADDLLTQQSGWLGLNAVSLGAAAQVPSCVCAQCARGSGSAPITAASTTTTKPLNISLFDYTGINAIDSLIDGGAWGTPTITYSFYDDTLNGAYYLDTRGVSEVSQAMKTHIRNILENYIEPFIDVNFAEVADTATSTGQVRYMLSNDAGYAHAYTPTPGFNASGDVHLNPAYDNNGSSQGWRSGPGSYGFETLIHETLHALGLKHPGNYNEGEPGPYLPHANDHNTNTVMTYSDSTHYAVSPMPYDILALQHLYGASNLNARNTVYTFDRVSGYSDGRRYWGSRTADVKLALWDAGGNDTFNFSGLAANARGYSLNLNAGEMLTTKAAYNAMEFIAPDDASQTPYRTTSFGTAIAYGSVIENVIGSSSADDITGNKAANQIDGRGGNDWIAGNNGQDTLLGGNGHDELLGENGNDGLVGGNGRDTINGGRGNDTLCGGQIAVREISRRARVMDSAMDVMIGGAGRDVFVLASGTQHDVIQDFQDGVDRLRFSLGINSNLVDVVQRGQNALVTVGQDVLAMLVGVRANQITAADIQFR